MSDTGRRWVASILTLALVVGTWAFIEWKSRPPAPPAVKAFPWEKEPAPPSAK